MSIPIPQVLKQAVPFVAKKLGITPEKVQEVIGELWNVFASSPDRAQIEQIRAFVADGVLHKRMGFAPAVAERLALELVCDSDDPTEAEKRAQVPVSPADLERVKADVVGIDVIYEKTSSGRPEGWRRQIRVLLKDEKGRILEVTQKSPLQHIDLPDAVRTALWEENQVSQRFVLFGDKQ